MPGSCVCGASGSPPAGPASPSGVATDAAIPLPAPPTTKSKESTRCDCDDIKKDGPAGVARGSANRAKMASGSADDKRYTPLYPAWLTVSKPEAAECPCGVPIRSDTPIAELAREWIRYRNAEDTGLWAPCAADGIHADSPAMLKFVHFMRNQYSGGGGGGCDASDRKSTSRARKSSAPAGAAAAAAASRPGWDAAPCACNSSLSPVREEQRVGEIAHELRRSVQFQSCGGACQEEGRGRPRAGSPKVPVFSDLPDEELAGERQRGGGGCGGCCGAPPRYCCSRCWVDDELSKCCRVSRRASAERCRPQWAAQGCPCTCPCCSPPPIAVFNFNECAATFQQHLHGEEECLTDDECPGLPCV